MKKIVLKGLLSVVLLAGTGAILASCDSTDPIKDLINFFDKEDKVGTTIELDQEKELDKIYLNHELTRKQVKNVLKTLEFNDKGIYNVGCWANVNGTGAYYLNVVNDDGVYSIVDSNETVYYVSEDIDEVEFVGWNKEEKSYIKIGKCAATQEIYTLFGIDSETSGKQNETLKDILSSKKFAVEEVVDDVEEEDEEVVEE